MSSKKERNGSSCLITINYHTSLLKEVYDERIISTKCLNILAIYYESSSDITGYISDGEEK